MKLSLPKTTVYCTFCRFAQADIFTVSFQFSYNYIKDNPLLHVGVRKTVKHVQAEVLETTRLTNRPPG